MFDVSIVERKAESRGSTEVEATFQSYTSSGVHVNVFMSNNAGKQGNVLLR